MRFLALILTAGLAGCSPAYATNLGPEEVVNGSFDTTDAWTLGYSWQILPSPGGVAFHNEGYTAPIEQVATGLTDGATYRVSYKISGSSTSTDPRHWFRMRGAFAFANGPALSGDGVHTFDIVAPVGTSSFQIRPGSGFGGVLDDVSIRQVLP